MSNRIDDLETALNRMVQLIQNLMDESEGRWPQPDPGCSYCTADTTPDSLNSGPCAYHNAQKLLGHIV